MLLHTSVTLAPPEKNEEREQWKDEEFDGNRSTEWTGVAVFDLITTLKRSWTSNPGHNLFSSNILKLNNFILIFQLLEIILLFTFF